MLTAAQAARTLHAPRPFDRRPRNDCPAPPIRTPRHDPAGLRLATRLRSFQHPPRL